MTYQNIVKELDQLVTTLLNDLNHEGSLSNNEMVERLQAIRKKLASLARPKKAFVDVDTSQILKMLATIVEHSDVLSIFKRENNWSLGICSKNSLPIKGCVTFWETTKEQAQKIYEETNLPKDEIDQNESNLNYVYLRYLPFV